MLVSRQRVAVGCWCFVIVVGKKEEWEEGREKGLKWTFQVAGSCITDLVLVL
jgi:hypothetical protein